MSNILSYVQHIFPGWGEKFCRGDFAPLVTGLLETVNQKNQASLGPHIFLSLFFLERQVCNYKTKLIIIFAARRCNSTTCVLRCNK